jgi:predicted  nucleic acid-binding Zn-ribbon protein
MSGEQVTPHSPPRRARRFPADLLPTLKATILAGPDVRVINVSKFGMLIESDVRLTPNASVCLNITLEGRTFPASGRVLRVDAALSGGRVKYRAGVQLDSEVAAFDLEEKEAAKEAAAPAAAPAKAKQAPQQPQAKPQPPPQTKPVPQPQAAQPAAQPQQAAASGTDAALLQETVQRLRASLQTSEAQRKELAAALDTERAKWDEQRRQYEQAVTHAKQSAEGVQKQVASAQKDTASVQKELAAARQELAAAQEERTAAQVETTEVRRELAAAREELAAAQKQAAAIRDVEKAHAKAQAAWDAERTAFEKRSKEVDVRSGQLMKELREAAEREKSLESQYAGATAQWDKERRDLQRAVEDLTARADRASRELNNARENEKRLSRKIDEQAESIDAFLADKRRMESEIETLRAAAAVAEEAASTYEQERAEWASHKEQLTERLELTDKLCTDQKDLLFHLRQQIGEAFALIDSWDPAVEATEGEQQSPSDPDAKLSAVQRLRKIIG